MNSVISKIIPTIPVVSAPQIWGMIGNVQIHELVIRAQSKEDAYKEELKPYFTEYTYPVSHHYVLNFKRRLHGDIEFGEVCHDLEKLGLPDFLMRKLTIADSAGMKYTFVNKRAPPQLEGYVKQLRRKFLSAKGLKSMGQLAAPRILRLMSMQNKHVRKVYIDSSVVFTEKTFTTLCREFGNVFCKLVEVVELGKVVKTKVESMEDTLWWNAKHAVSVLNHR